MKAVRAAKKSSQTAAMPRSEGAPSIPIVSASLRPPNRLLKKYPRSVSRRVKQPQAPAGQPPLLAVRHRISTPRFLGLERRTRYPEHLQKMLRRSDAQAGGAYLSGALARSALSELSRLTLTRPSPASPR